MFRKSFQYLYWRYPARERLAERRNAILRIFREYQIPVEPGGDQQIRPVPYRFLETPPGYETIRPVFFERNERAAYAEVVRLRWQLESDALLLADRVVDALMIMDQALQTESRSLVKLVRHLDRPRAEETLPWKVVIETDAPER